MKRFLSCLLAAFLFVSGFAAAEQMPARKWTIGFEINQILADNAEELGMGNSDAKMLLAMIDLFNSFSFSEVFSEAGDAGRIAYMLGGNEIVSLELWEEENGTYMNNSLLPGITLALPSGAIRQNVGGALVQCAAQVAEDLAAAFSVWASSLTVVSTKGSFSSPLITGAAAEDRYVFDDADLAALAAAVLNRDGYSKNTASVMSELFAADMWQMLDSELRAFFARMGQANVYSYELHILKDAKGGELGGSLSVLKAGVLQGSLSWNSDIALLTVGSGSKRIYLTAAGTEADEKASLELNVYRTMVGDSFVTIKDRGTAADGSAALAVMRDEQGVYTVDATGRTYLPGQGVLRIGEHITFDPAEFSGSYTMRVSEAEIEVFRMSLESESVELTTPVKEETVITSEDPFAPHSEEDDALIQAAARKGLATLAARLIKYVPAEVYAQLILPLMNGN